MGFLMLTGSVPQYQTTSPTMTQSYIDTGQVSPAHGANVFISGPLSMVCGGGGGGGGNQLRNPHTSPFHSCLFLPSFHFQDFVSSNH